MRAQSPPVAEIAWNTGTMAEWNASLLVVPRVPLTQSMAYADAMAREKGFVPRLGRISVAGRAVALVQVLERRGVKLFTARQLHRGPLWIDGIPENPSVIEAVMRGMRAACPRGLLDRASLLPELPAGEGTEALMARAGFHRVGPGYQTVWLDLTRPLDAIRAAWSPSARQRLRAAEKVAPTLDVDLKCDNLPWLMAKEAGQAAVKGFKPLSGRMAVRLRNALVRDDSCFMITALLPGGSEPAAAGLFLIHGGSATYQVGWTGDAGRKTHATRLILWKAVEILKERGVTALDLGGINPDHAAGVTEFKLSLGGERVESVGLYR